MINIVKESTPAETFHKCPYEGKVVVIGKALRLLSIYPQGKYRIDFKIFNDHNDVLVYFEVEVEITLDLFCLSLQDWRFTF